MPKKLQPGGARDVLHVMKDLLDLRDRVRDARS